MRGTLLPPKKNIVFSTLCQYKCFIKWKKSAITRRYIENLILDSSPESHTFFILFREKVKKKVFLKNESGPAGGRQEFPPQSRSILAIKGQTLIGQSCTKGGYTSGMRPTSAPKYGLKGSQVLKKWEGGRTLWGRGKYRGI